jgi:Dolichyl-phosphate-mannose-protein mannosyltransferase
LIEPGFTCQERSLEVSDTVPYSQAPAHGFDRRSREGSRTISGPVTHALYGLLLVAACAIWFIAIRAPLWLDETVSMYLIRGGFAGIMARQVWPDSPTYSCLLWLWTLAMGAGEIMLRVSSLLPMLGATYLLYRAASLLFDREAAMTTTIAFCIHPIIIFAAIDIRPYAFAALALNASILTLVHLRRNDSNWLAGLFGMLAACVVQFQLLFAVILPALLLCFVALKWKDRKTLWRQLGIALAAFCGGSIPAIPRIEYMFHTSATHVFAELPTLLELGSTLTLKGLAGILVAAVLIAAATRQLELRTRLERWPVLLCISLALVPILTLYFLSLKTSIHVFVPRYRLVAVPGIALCWGLVANLMVSRWLRLLVCATAVGATAYICWTTPFLRQHQYSWKYALAFVQDRASKDNTPVLICSDIPESDHMKMPVGPAIAETGILPPLSYYKLTVPVVVLPRALNAEAIRGGSEFLERQEKRRQHFFAMAFAQSYETLNWLSKEASANEDVQEAGTFDGVRVLEFKPRAGMRPANN